jgi:hypothetical protein
MNRTLNIGYLVVGLVFIGISASWALHANGVLDDHSFQWFVPATLLGAGLIGLFASLGKGVAGRIKKPEPTTSYDEDQPVLDLTSDLDRKLADHETSIIDNEGNQS